MITWNWQDTNDYVEMITYKWLRGNDKIWIDMTRYDYMEMTTQKRMDSNIEYDLQ